jgi:hypothetical protein
MSGGTSKEVMRIKANHHQYNGRNNPIKIELMDIALNDGRKPCNKPEKKMSE